MLTRSANGPAGPAADAEAALRRRLQWLMVGRLLVASLLLGATLLVVIEPEAGVASFTPRTLLLLIAGTYAASLGFAVWLPRTTRLRAVSAAQLTWDLAMVTGLVFVSGGVASVFTFLYGISILAAAIVVGPRAARATAVTSILGYVVLGISVANGWLPHPPDQPAERYLLGAEATGFSLMSNVVGLTLVGLLAGNLAGRLRRAGTALERAAESVASLERLTDDIVRSLSSGLLTTDLGGRVRTVNPAGAAMFRVEEGALVGRPASDLLPLEAAAGSSERADGVARREDGSTFPVGYTATPLVGADGEVTGTLVSFQDLTEIAELRHAAERAERLATLGRLAAGLAHEIRNPLSSISGSVQLVREAVADEEDRRLLGIVLGEVERLDDLVTNMLQIGRPRVPARTRCDLGALLADVVEMARTGLAGDLGIEIDYHRPAEPVEVEVDPGQIRQVAWNLAKNALQASPPGARVEVRVARGTHGGAVLEVRDHGEGIDAETRARLFETFYSSRPHGVGLGLALVEQIVDQHGGEIEVESTPGEGATFRVRLAG